MTGFPRFGVRAARGALTPQPAAARPVRGTERTTRESTCPQFSDGEAGEVGAPSPKVWFQCLILRLKCCGGKPVLLGIKDTSPSQSNRHENWEQKFHALAKYFIPDVGELTYLIGLCL